MAAFLGQPVVESDALAKVEKGLCSTTRARLREIFRSLFVQGGYRAEEDMRNRRNLARCEASSPATMMDEGTSLACGPSTVTLQAPTNVRRKLMHSPQYCRPRSDLLRPDRRLWMAEAVAGFPKAQRSGVGFHPWLMIHSARAASGAVDVGLAAIDQL